MIPPNPDAKLWLFDFDNTLAALEREVDWPGSRRELEAYLRAEGIDQEIFASIPKGNLPLYAALHSRWLRQPPEPASVAGAIPPLAPAPHPVGAIPPPADAPHAAASCTAVLPPARAEALLRRASEIIERHELIGAERAAPTLGAIDLLRAIAPRGAVAIIVTSNSSRTVARWLELHRVSDLVPAIVGRDSLLALKPSREMIARAIALAATFAADGPATIRAAEALAAPSTANAVFVGDSLADFEAARAAGLGFYGIAATDSARARLIAAGATDNFTCPAALRIRLNLPRYDRRLES